MRSGQHKRHIMLFLAYILFALPYPLQAVTHRSIYGSDKDSIEKAISISTKEDRYGTKVSFRLNGKISSYRTRAMNVPSRIVVDIFHTIPPFETISVPAESAILEKVRIGYHPKLIRMVLDLKGPGIRGFTTSSNNTELLITLLSSKSIGNKKSGFDRKIPSASIKTPDSTRMEKEINIKKRYNTGNRPKTPVKTKRSIEEENTESAKKHQFKNRLQDRLKEKRIADSTELTLELAVMEEDDGQHDTAVFLKGLSAYRVINYSGAVESFNNLIKAYPAGRYTERAYFLLAKSYEQLFSDAVSENFMTIKRYYDDAIYGFPTSIYVQDALIAIGNLCYKNGNHTEALGYYNLAIEQEKDSINTLKALLPKAKILISRGDMEEALSILEFLIGRYPASPMETEAKIEMSKIYYEKNNYKKSLNILTELETKKHADLFKHPDMYLYLGYNHSQMGNSIMARKYLFRFFNSSPHREESDLVLTKIADTYRDEGLSREATKIYQLVLELYPETEGALISLTRLAEQLEEGELVIGKENGTSIKVGGKKLYEHEEIYMSVVKKLSQKDTGNPLVDLAMLSLNAFYQKKEEMAAGRENRPSMKIGGKNVKGPEDIYMDIIEKLSMEDKENPLVQLAMVKLAVFFQKEKRYDESLNILMDLLRECPRSKLRKKIIHVLNLTLDPIFKENIKEERYVNIINIYQKGEDLFSLLESPDLFLNAARAFIHLDLQDMAAEVFEKADALLLDREKPSDLLFHVSMDLFEKGDLKNALARLNLLIENYPSEKYVPHAYKIKGEILLDQKEYLQAAEMFSSALGYRQEPCERIRIILDKTKALMAINLKEEAAKAAREAGRFLGECHYPYPLSLRLGDLLLDLGYPYYAISIFAEAHETEKERDNRIRYKLAIAKGYEFLDKKDDSIAIYNQISGLNDPFWSNLAEEKIREIDFDRKINEFTKNIK